MKFDFELPPLSLNPFKMSIHNSVRMPRIVNHLLHFAIGFVVWAVMQLVIPAVFHVTFPLWAIVIALLVADVWNKCSWIDTVNKKIWWWVPWPEVMVWDFIGDTILTLMPVLITLCPWAMIPVYYLASLLSDPY